MRLVRNIARINKEILTSVISKLAKVHLLTHVVMRKQRLHNFIRASLTKSFP